MINFQKSGLWLISSIRSFQEFRDVIQYKKILKNADKMRFFIVNNVINYLDIVVVHPSQVFLLKNALHLFMRWLGFDLAKFTILMRAKQVFFNISLDEKFSCKNVLVFHSKSNFNFLFKWVLWKAKIWQKWRILSIGTRVLPSVSGHNRIRFFKKQIIV